MAPMNEVDGIDLIGIWIKDWLSKHQPSEKEETPYNRDGGAETNPVSFPISFFADSIINPFKKQNWLLYMGICGLALGLMLISIYFYDSILYGVLVFLFCEVFFLLFIFNDRFKIPIDVTSSAIFLFINVLLFLLDVYILYKSNPYNQGLPIKAYEYAFMGVIFAVYTFSIVQVTYSYFRRYRLSKKK